MINPWDWQALTAQATQQALGGMQLGYQPVYSPYQYGTSTIYPSDTTNTDNITMSNRTFENEEKKQKTLHNCTFHELLDEFEKLLTQF